MDATLRTAKSQARYEEKIKNGDTNNIADLPAPKVAGMKYMKNAYEMDIAHENGRMLVGSKWFWPSFMRLGWIIWRDKTPYHQMILNHRSKMSQRHVWHWHVVDFKERSEFSL